MLTKLIFWILIISIVFADDDPLDKEAENAFLGSIILLCKNSDMDDTVVGNIISNCNFGKIDNTHDWGKIHDAAIMECTKQTSITDRQRLTALCSETVAKCYGPVFETKIKGLEDGKETTDDEKKKWIVSMNNTWTCINGYVPNKE